MKKTLFVLILSLPLWGVQLSKQLRPSDVDKITEILGYGGATRLMRSAEPFREGVGLKIGVESALVPGSSLNNLGNNTGSTPGLIPAPRLFVAKSLTDDFEGIFSFFSPSIIDTLSSVGVMSKWTFYDEKSNYVSAAAYVGYTHLSAFSEAYTGDDIEAGLYFSRDYVRLRPYFGAGLLFANGNVAKTYAPTIQSSWQSTVHFFLGMEFEFPINFTMQIDIMNTTPQGSILVSKRI